MLARLRRFAQSRSVDGRIARAAVLSGGLSIGVKTASFAKEMLVAAVFGVSGQIDAYLIALMLVGIPHGVVVNAFQWTLIPEFIRAQSAQGRAGSRPLLQQAVALTLLVLAVSLLAWSMLLPWLSAHLSRAGGPAAAETVRSCLMLLIVYYFASGALLMGYAILQAEKRFLVNGAVPITTPVVIALVILVTRTPSAETLATGMALGFLVELMLVESILRRQGLTLLPANPFRGRLGRPFARNAARLSLGAVLLSLVPLVEQAAAAELGVGAIATLGYANKLPALVSGLVTLAIGVAVFPYFAEMLAAGQFEQCRRTLNRFAAAAAAIGVFLAAALIAFSEPLVRLAFARGAFTEDVVLDVSLAQQGYLVQIPGGLVFVLSVRLLLAQGRAGSILALSGMQLALFAMTVAAGVQLARWPAVIALGYSLALTLTAAAGFLMATRAVRPGVECEA